MFLVAFLVAIIIGYILKGNIKNIDASKIKKIHLVFIAFGIEFVMVMLIQNNYIEKGIATLVLNIIMYVILFIFIFFNRDNKWILLMGLGFVLNALPIFFNGGSMPVNGNAMKTVGLTQNVTTEGLYVLMDSSTRVAFLGDIIPIKVPRAYVMSIGDVVEVIALSGFIITEMKRKTDKKERA